MYKTGIPVLYSFVERTTLFYAAYTETNLGRSTIKNQSLTQHTNDSHPMTGNKTETTTETEYRTSTTTVAIVLNELL